MVVQGTSPVYPELGLNRFRLDIYSLSLLHERFLRADVCFVSRNLIIPYFIYIRVLTIARSSPIDTKKYCIIIPSWFRIAVKKRPYLALGTPKITLKLAVDNSFCIIMVLFLEPYRFLDTFFSIKNSSFIHLSFF